MVTRCSTGRKLWCLQVIDLTAMNQHLQLDRDIVPGSIDAFMLTRSTQQEQEASLRGTVSVGSVAAVQSHNTVGTYRSCHQ